jgi:sulfur-oxidizing protein SoxY
MLSLLVSPADTGSPPMSTRPTVARRTVLAGLAGALTAATAPAVAQTATPAPSPRFQAAWDEVVRGRPVATGALTLDVPRLAESGNSVPLKVAVDGPGSADRHVMRIHLLSEQNPLPTIGRFHFGPTSVPEVETSIRLATTQHVHAIAELSDGTLTSAKAEVVVLLAACLDAG